LFRDSAFLRFEKLRAPGNYDFAPTDHLHVHKPCRLPPTAWTITNQLVRFPSNLVRLWPVPGRCSAYLLSTWSEASRQRVSLNLGRAIANQW